MSENERAEGFNKGYVYYEMDIILSRWTGEDKRLWEAEVRYEYPYFADGGAFLGWRNAFKPARKHLVDLNVLRMAEIRCALEDLGLPGLRTPQSIGGHIYKEGKGWVEFVVPEEEGGE